MFRFDSCFPGCGQLVRNSAAIIAAMLVFAAAAHAGPQPPPLTRMIDFPLAEACYGAVWPARDTESTGGNQYLLLLIFDSSAVSAVNTLLNTTPAPLKDHQGNVVKDAKGKDVVSNYDGCWPNPDYQGNANAKGKAKVQPKLLRVQGSCPTDCVTPPRLAALDKEKPLTLFHDPLSLLDGNPGWGLFFTDRTGGADTSPDDPDTNLVVWQILVADAGQAGRVLKSLENNNTNPHLFTNRNGFIGHLMIGYRPITSVAATLN